VSEAAVSVRPADFGQAADLARFVDLLDAYARDPMGGGTPLDPAVRERLVRDLPRRPGLYGLLAEHGDEAVGFATCLLGYSTFRARPLLNVHDIAVLPGWRGRGIGGRLLEAAAELGRRLQCCRITLEVRPDNPAAQRLYARSGFVPAACSLFMERPLD
jgi:ribosomal protein S18 acetylase RimI-like enzyme